MRGPGIKSDLPVAATYRCISEGEDGSDPGSHKSYKANLLRVHRILILALGSWILDIRSWIPIEM
jgi:hypothetical protein